MVPGVVALYVAAMLVTAGINLAFVLWLRRTREWTRATQAATVVVMVLTVSALVTAVRAVLGQVTEGSRAMAATFVAQSAVSELGPPAFVLFAVYFTGRTALLTRSVKVLLGLVAAVPATLIATQPLHGGAYAEFGRTEGPFVRLTAETTWLHDALTTPNSLLVYVAMALLLQFALSSRRVSRRQFVVLLAAPVPFLTVRAAGSFGPLAENVNYGVMTNSLILLAIGATLLRGTTFAVDPVARDTVLDDIQDAVVTVDRAGTVADYNDAALHLFPEIADRIGEPLAEVAPGLVDDQGSARVGVGTGVTGSASETETATDGGATGDRYVDELVRYRDGDRSVHDVVVSPVSVDGEHRGETLLLRDITERRQRKERLERETEQLDEFVSTVSHDLRNPLTVARGYVETAKQAHDDETLTEAEASLDRMERMIEDTLALAREGRAIDDRRLVSLADAVGEAWRGSETGDATLEAQVEDVSIYADPDRLDRLFGNLFRNAVEHGATGSQRQADGVTVTVTVDRSDGAIRVGDDGPGVPPERRERVLERGHTTSEDGTGLGLAIVESIAEAHGWTVSVGESPAGGALISVEGVDLHHGVAADGD